MDLQEPRVRRVQEIPVARRNGFDRAATAQVMLDGAAGRSLKLVRLDGTWRVLVGVGGL
jgi:hypothetical protein